ncbi:MAG TPA: response regulator [Steroidobacteraceae bacterium]|jgi:CheY-like chemotaxis protein|nr:response regulator [Steroidobacteraceae bacterium]
MMARRALVVDDSKSARAFLTRILERYELAVDGVETAEQAIEYLTIQRPDVIFMDHLMPGMDGFQAVQAIKNNPRTATIPIMMYTSQEGELYLSQARALGAIGVLPKQIKHADVSQVLQQLHLLGETPQEDEVATIHADGPPPEIVLPLDTAPPLDTTSERRGPNRPKAPPLPADQRLVMEGMLAHHMLDVRRFISENLESNADRIVSDLRLLMQDQVPPSAGFEPAARPPDWKLWLAAAALVAAFLFGLQWSKQRGGAEALTAQLAKTQQQLTDTQQNLLSLQAADAAAAASVPPPETESPTEPAEPVRGSSLLENVPFGETPLAGPRLERISALLTRLTASGFHGVVQIRSIPGRFCTVTGPGGTPVLAADAALYSKCEQVGNPRDDNTSAGQRQSVAFANMVSTARENAAGKIDVQISAGTPDEVIASYPAVSDTMTAGEWNRAAAANNRVEVHWQATH